MGGALPCYRIEDDGITVQVRASPKASRTAILGTMETADGGALKVAVTAVPDKGKANAAVASLLAKTFGVPKSNVVLVSGGKDRRKVVRVTVDPVKLSAIADQWSLI